MNSQKDGRGRFLLIKAKGGMGNRMLCAATGILYAAITERTPVVDWRDFTYSDDGSNVFLRYFNSSFVRPESALPAGDDIYPTIWRGNLSTQIGEMIQKNDPDKHSSLIIHRKYSIDVRRTDYTNDIAVFWYYTHRLNQLLPRLRGRLMDRIGDVSSFHAALKNTLRVAMPLDPAILKSVDDFEASHFRQPTIGIHVRYTDLKVDLGAYERSLEGLLKTVKSPRIFLATDNAGVIERFQKRYGQVITTQKWLPAEGASLHQNKACPSRFSNGIDALVDMYLLARCDYTIFSSRSTFSWISTFISDRPSRCHIDVDRNNLRHRLKQWFRDQVA